jgi:hypothetical protein
MSMGFPDSRAAQPCTLPPGPADTCPCKGNEQWCCNTDGAHLDLSDRAFGAVSDFPPLPVRRTRQGGGQKPLFD